VTNRERVRAWISDYERAWRSAGTDSLANLFTEDATYRPGPYSEALVGLSEIAEWWEAERDGPDEGFEMVAEVLAVDGELAVARIEVRYEDPAPHDYRDLWVIEFAGDGRCRSFEEWPFWPGQPLAAPATG
jgi:uncharacterized protein (TIGR02246 family)